MEIMYRYRTCAYSSIPKHRIYACLHWQQDNKENCKGKQDNKENCIKELCADRAVEPPKPHVLLSLSSPKKKKKKSVSK